MEQWKSINGYEGLYEVSDCGRVRRLAGYRARETHILHPGCVSVGRGYRAAVLCKNGICKMILVHRLVAQAFVPPRAGCRFVNHKDGDKQNNNATNLEYVTMAENNRHAYDVLGKREKMPRGAANHQAKLTDDDVREIRALRLAGGTLQAIGDRYGVCFQTVANIANGTTWGHLQH